MPGISAQEITRRGRLLQTGQTSTYAVGDDGDHEAGIGKAYYVLDAGAYAGTSNIEVANYAAPTLSFTAPNTIADAGADLEGWAVNDLMVIKGTASNDGVVTVTGIGGAPNNLTISAAVDEVAGAYMSLYQLAAHSNNCVFDRRTGRMWSRFTSNGEKVGFFSDGRLEWFSAANSVFTLHPAAADVQIFAAPWNAIKVIGGAGEVLRYHVGDLLSFAGFASAANNLPAYYVRSVTVNALDLDIVLDPVNNVLVEELAPGAVSIGLVTRSIFNYAAGANLIGLAGYTDWRNPCDTALMSLRNMEAPDGTPDAAAFPGWPDFGSVWTSTTDPTSDAIAMYVRFAEGFEMNSVKHTDMLCALVRS